MNEQYRQTPAGPGGAGQENGNGQGLSLSRLAAISDGIFAIVVTLLVLLIEVPPKELTPDMLTKVLYDDWHKLVAYALSFLIVAVYWWRHHTIFMYLARADWGLVALNLVFLLWVALIPFPTGLLCEYYHTSQVDTAVLLFAAVQLICTLLLLLTWRYTVRRPHLLYRDLEADEKNGLTWLQAEDAVLYLVAALLSRLLPHLSLLLLVLALLLNLLPHRRRAHVVDLRSLQTKKTPAG